MTEAELQAWMKNVNTQMLELILTISADKPDWYTRTMTAEVQRRHAKEQA